MVAVKTKTATYNSLHSTNIDLLTYLLTTASFFLMIQPFTVTPGYVISPNSKLNWNFWTKYSSDWVLFLSPKTNA